MILELSLLVVYVSDSLEKKKERSRAPRPATLYLILNFCSENTCASGR